ncbi:uncharacterized protein K460DRAFT_403452 [Cucurbitaria berberidis CBS 394.84]|uniref:Uncharacterized protein n=1 Tax=Cucurbitaria berberidis CBS 394.84 TaxID=1168544 RepID=A0A9P4GNB3_9PLEO|nr:uncharacterized protein K460DRAFT_403452 [Cucurbitaria berberidis CBS 394.84]KAF1848155.1 hypothetical protein K460DRAFT_403452 [Cucurbitaria berberidis CBS 394.84]
MHAADFSPLYTKAGSVVGHAHPSPGKPIIPTDDTQHLRDLVASVPFNVTLDGLGTKDNATASDLLFPRVRRSPFSDEAISHLDVVSCWKGISHSQGVELELWQRLFRKCLASQVEEGLRDIVTNRLIEYQRQIDETMLIPRLALSLSGTSRQCIDINITRLIREIMETFYECHHEATPECFAWSLGSGDLPRFLYNFLRTQDCFRHTLTGPAVLVNVSSLSCTSSVLAVVANLAWQPPDIRFNDIPKNVIAGEKICIIPRHVDTTLQYQSTSLYPMSDRTHYTVSGPSLNLKRDPNDDFFRGRVPCWTNEQQCKPSVAETVLSANIVTPFSETVRFARTSRYIIKLHVTHAECLGLGRPHSPTETEVNWVPSYTSTPLSKTRHNEPKEAIDYAFSHAQLCRSPVSSEKDAAEDKATSPFRPNNHLFNPSAQIQSPMKRKAPQSRNPTPAMNKRFVLDSVENLTLDIDSKRCRLVQAQDQDVNMYGMPPGPSRTPPREPTSPASCLTGITLDYTGKADLTTATPGPVHEEHDSPCLGIDRRSTTNACSTCQHQKPPAATLKARATQTSFSWKQCNTPPYMDSDNSSVPNIIPPNTCTNATHSKHSTALDLSQEQIQHNYQEFLEQAKRKALEKAYQAAIIPLFDGKVSPTNDADRSFEQVFFADTDSEVGEWTCTSISDVDGLSEGVESVDMEA